MLKTLTCSHGVLISMHFLTLALKAYLLEISKYYSIPSLAYKGKALVKAKAGSFHTLGLLIRFQAWIITQKRLF